MLITRPALQSAAIVVVASCTVLDVAEFDASWVEYVWFRVLKYLNCILIASSCPTTF